MLNIIGIGLNDEKDITLKGLEVIQDSDFVYLENYTSKLNIPIERLEKLYKKKIILANRELVEQSGEIISNAKKYIVSFLVIGDPFSATTHLELFLEAKKQKIKVKIINNASVLTAIGITGLSLYKFGKIISIPFDNKNLTSVYESYLQNKNNDLHTLFLLDIKDKLMTAREALDYLISQGLDKNTKVVVCGALGNDDPDVGYGKAKDVKIKKFPQCLIIPAKMHFMEEEVLNLWK